MKLHCMATLRAAMSGGGSRASASALTSGMPLVGGESNASSSLYPMLASETDLGIGDAFTGVIDIGSAASHAHPITACTS